MDFTTSDIGELDDMGLSHDWAAGTAKYVQSDHDGQTADSAMQRLQIVENSVHSLKVSLRGAEQTVKDGTARIQQLEDLAAKLEQRAFEVERSLKAAHAIEQKDTTTAARKRLVDASMSGLAKRVNDVECATRAGAERLQLLEMRYSNTENNANNLSMDILRPLTVGGTRDVMQLQTETVEERMETLEAATAGATRQLDDMQGLLDGKAGMEAVEQVWAVVNGLSARLEASEKNKGVGTGTMVGLKNLQCPLDRDHGTMLHASNRGPFNEQGLQMLIDRVEQLEEAFCGTERQLAELQQGTPIDGVRPSRPPQVGRFNGVVLELEQQLAETRSRDSERRVEVDAVQGEVQQFSRDLNGLHLRFSAMQESLQGKADAGSLEHLAARIQSMGNSRIESCSAELMDHMLKSELASLSRKVAMVEAAVKHKADIQSLELLQAAVEELVAQLRAQDHCMTPALEGRLQELEGALMSIQGKASAAEARFNMLENVIQEKPGATFVQQLLQQGVQEVLEQMERAQPPVSAAPVLTGGSCRDADERIDLVLRKLQDMVSVLEANMVGQQVHVDGSTEYHQQQLEETVMAMQAQLCDVERFLQERVGLEPVQSLKSMLLIFQTQMSSLEQHLQGPAAAMQLQQLRNQISTLDMQLAGVRSASTKQQQPQQQRQQQQQQQQDVLPRSQQQLHKGGKDLHQEFSGLQNKVSGLERGAWEVMGCVQGVDGAVAAMKSREAGIERVLQEKASLGQVQQLSGNVDAIWEKIYSIDQMVQAGADRVHGLEGSLLNVSTQMIAMQRSASTFDSLLSSSLPSQPPLGLEDDLERKSRMCTWDH